MKKTVIFAGTTEGRILSEHLVRAGAPHILCVATEYGEIVLKSHPLAEVHRGRMGQEEIREFLQTGDFLAVVDATHPYAENITHNIKSAVKGMDIPYLRLKRESLCRGGCRKQKEQGQTVFFSSPEECAGALEGIKGNILLTTGSKELSRYCVCKEVRDRLYVRVLPGIESLSLCMEQGIRGKQIIAMQGPFSVEMNEAVIRQFAISCLVTKESGTAGGYQEKLDAARNAGIPVFVVGRPAEEEGYSLNEVYFELDRLYEKQDAQGDCRLDLILAGMGMGAGGCLTREVQAAAENADILLGAERMLSYFSAGQEKYPFYQAEQILPYLMELQENMLPQEQKKVVILFSGDTGFYSGCRTLYRVLDTEVRSGRLRADIRILPGISSVSYLAACIGESYQDAAIYSMHGRSLCNLAGRIRCSGKTFLLMSGVRDVNRLGKILLEAGLSRCEVVTGYQLSYAGQQVRTYTPQECCGLQEEGLYTCFVRNPDAVPKKRTPGMADEAFIRGKVPMTKEEVREISICKLRLYDQAVVYDIGSGTGSVAAEIAALSGNIRVFALEKKQEAILLIQKNKEQFGLENLTVVETEAPGRLDELPVPTHALIGGSGGRLKEILAVLYQRNPKLRIVIHAISMETISEIGEILSGFPVKGEEVVQLQVSRARKAGNYHLMQAENPVWICAFDFCETNAVEE